MVAEWSNALVYLMISALELKVEGSNPVVIYFRLKSNLNAFGLEWIFA